MGAYNYITELYRKKQSDVMRYLLRIRAWQYRQLTRLHRVPRTTRPDKARRMGYRAKQGFVIYRVCMRRGGRKRPVAKGCPYGKPKSSGAVNEQKPVRNLQAIAEGRAGKRLRGLRVLNSYWVAQDSTYKYFEVILIDSHHKTIRRDPRMNWICRTVHKHREQRGLTAACKRSRGLGKGRRFNGTIGGSRRARWIKQNTLQLHRKRPCN
jgi:large subunit ribosomal protein L15e